MNHVPSTHIRPRPEGPRRVRNGIRFKRKEGIDNLAWPAAPWKEHLLHHVGEAALIKAFEYARAGQIRRLEVECGRVKGVVQCMDAKPLEVTIEFPGLSEAAWHRVLERSATEAIYAAKLLAGEFPEIVKEPFDSVGHPLVPQREEIRTACTCGAMAPCLHTLVVVLVLLERLEEFPELAFELRGRSGERFRHDLQEARMLATRGVTQAHTNSEIVQLAGSIRSIDSRLDDFWRAGSALEDSRQTSLPEHVPHALLRRLGASPLDGRFPITGLLASIYDTVAQAAEQMRDNAERPDHSE
jgi:uncharacterized Zn finger protein